MKLSDDNEDKLLVSLADISSLFRRKKNKIFAWTLCFGLMGVLYTLIQPIHYRAEASFKEKNSKSGGMQNSLLQFLSTGESFPSGNENEAATMINSRRILSEVIKKLNLQADIVEKGQDEHRLKLFYRNLLTSWASFRNYQHPIHQEIRSPISVSGVSYAGEIPLNFEVALQDSGDYEMTSLTTGQKLKNGKLNQSYQSDDATFTLLSKENTSGVTPAKYILTVKPMHTTATDLSKKIDIKIDKNDKAVLRITFDHRNRVMASQVLNTIMKCFQDHLKCNRDEIAKLQLDYLNVRQNQLGTNLNQLMEKHADFLSSGLYDSGFADSAAEMDFLAKRQHEYKEKLLANELEIERLEGLQPNAQVYFDRHSSSHEGDYVVINNILDQIRTLKQRRDQLEIDLQKKIQFVDDHQQETFLERINELDDVNSYLAELQDIFDRFHQQLPADVNSRLYNDSRFFIKGWWDRLVQLKQTDEEEWRKGREHFQNYLFNLERLFNVHGKILKERLTHQQNPSGEYHGIDLKVAEDLYLDYCKQLILHESTIRQNIFFIKQIEDSNFELTSLSSCLHDPVSQEMVQKSIQLILNLKDQDNQSEREQVRIKNDLAIQRTFLSLHLKQMVQLMELNKQMLNEKILALQNVSLELIHQNISVLENNLKDYLESRLENLRQERQLIREHLNQIRHEMSSLPNKWIAEKMIQQEVDVNHLIVQEIAKMVETKNINHNLEVIQSAPIDEALSPIHPLPPNILAYALVGCFLGALLGGTIEIGKTLKNGLPASPNNLKQLGYHVAGILSHRYDPDSKKVIADADLDTLRRLETYMNPIGPSKEMKIGLAKKLLLIEGRGPDYLPDLAQLLKRRGEKVLVIYLDSKAETDQATQPGLLQYLEGHAAVPKIYSMPYGDMIKSGGESRFALELITSTAFSELLLGVEKNYDWIIAISQAMASSVEAESLASIFPNIAVTIENEFVEELSFYQKFKRKPEAKLSFVFVDNDHQVS